MLKTGKSLYFHSTLQKERCYLQLFLKLPLFIILCSSLHRRLVVVLRVSSLPLILNLLLLLVQIGDLWGAEETDGDWEGEKYWERKRVRMREHAWKREGGREGREKIMKSGQSHEEEKLKITVWLFISPALKSVTPSCWLGDRGCVHSAHLGLGGGTMNNVWAAGPPTISSISTSPAGWHSEQENIETTRYFSFTGST